MMNDWNLERSRVLYLRPLVILLMATFLVGTAGPAQAASRGLGDLLDALVSGGRRTSPSSADDIFRIDPPSLKRLPLEQVEALKRLNRLEGVDDSLRRKIMQLPAGERTTLIELAEAGQKVLRRHPGDEGWELLRKLDSDGLAQMRTYGDFVADAVATPQLGPKYKDIVRKMGRGAGVFYRKYIAPNKAELAAAGLLTAYLAAPEWFHDAAGELTSDGAEALGGAGVDIPGHIVRGFWEGVRSQFVEDPVFSSLGLALVLGLLALTVGGVRSTIMGCLRFAWKRIWGRPVVSVGEGKNPHRYEE